MRPILVIYEWLSVNNNRPKLQHAATAWKPNTTKETTVDRLNTATKHNPPGVRVVTRNLKAQWAYLAQYNGFPDTNEFKKRLNSWLVGSGVWVAFLNPNTTILGVWLCYDFARIASFNSLSVWTRLLCSIHQSQYLLIPMSQPRQEPSNWTLQSGRTLSISD